jgi:hypothetical protein
VAFSSHAQARLGNVRTVDEDVDYQVCQAGVRIDHAHHYSARGRRILRELARRGKGGRERWCCGREGKPCTDKTVQQRKPSISQGRKREEEEERTRRR